PRLPCARRTVDLFVGARLQREACAARRRVPNELAGRTLEPVMICTKCGTANAPAARFCANCGAPLAQTPARPAPPANPAAPVAATRPAAPAPANPPPGVAPPPRAMPAPAAPAASTPPAGVVPPPGGRSAPRAE